MMTIDTLALMVLRSLHRSNRLCLFVPRQFGRHEICYERQKHSESLALFNRHQLPRPGGYRGRRYQVENGNEYPNHAG